MHPDIRNISSNMKDFGFKLLGKAIFEAAFTDGWPSVSHSLSVVTVANGAEIIIKARIAQEHPLLIFNSYPKSKGTSSTLNFEELFEKGRTLMYPELPDVLWATTGYRIEKLEEFLNLGKLRNGIVHFGHPIQNASDEALRFAFEVLDPMVWDFWNETFVEYSSAWDDDIFPYLWDALCSSEVNIYSKTKNLFDGWLGDK